MRVVIIAKLSETTKRRIQGIFPAEWKISVIPPEKLNITSIEADVIIPEHIMIDEPFLDRVKHLKLIQTGAGFDNINIEACTERRVWVANAAGINALAVAEHVFSFILCWYKNIVLLDEMLKQGEYSVNYIGSELSGKVIGIIGLGNVGTEVARIANTFNMKVLAYDIRTMKISSHIEFVDFITLLKQSDIVTLHIRLNNQTRHMISQKELSLMKENAFLINTSRGPIVDENALIKSLQVKEIGGAGIDVFETEPLSENSPLRRIKNVILTPHTAGRPDGLKFHQKRYEFFRDNIQRITEGKAPHNALNQI